MIAAWMLYATVVAGVLGVAALALDRALTLYRQPSRFVWAGAMAAGLVFPLLVRVGLFQRAAEGQPIEGDVLAAVPTALSIPSDAIARAGAATPTVDTLLLAAWSLASVVMLTWLVWSLLRLQGDRASWAETMLNGVPVLVSRNVGPAIVGLSSTAIVVPRWLLDAGPATQRLALLHEREHLRAGDTRLLLFALVAVALAPWNLAIWWQLHRLRAAVELDCDRRVLRTGVVPKAYADALLHIGERTVPVALPRSALAEPKSLLSRRITEMLPTRVRARLLRAVAYGTAALGLLAVACDAPPPRLPTEPGDSRPRALPRLEAQLTIGDAVDEPAERISCPVPEYPGLLRQAGIEGAVLLQFVVGTDGRVEPGTVEVLQSEHRGFEAAAKQLVTGCAFRAARLDGKPARAQAQMPVMFRLGRAAQAQATFPRPLYVVDGVVVADSIALDLDAMEIETIEVIKAELAQALYSWRGKHGVVRITTKRRRQQD
ncbi:MAG: TonB family protein [Armatimonadota bacterium]